MKKNVAKKAVHVVPVKPATMYDQLAEERMAEMFDTFDAVIAFAPEDVKKKLEQFRENVRHKLEAPNTCASIELAHLAELQIIEDVICKLRNMVTVTPATFLG